MPTVIEHKEQKKEAYKNAELKQLSFFNRILDWERWPSHAFFVPLYFYGFYKVLRARVMWPFSTSNPGLEFGGFFGMGKMEMYDLIPDASYPTTRLIRPSDSFDSVLSTIKEAGLSYPFVAKPDVGMQGLLFRIIKDEAQLRRYYTIVQTDWLVQAFVPYEREFGIFYVRHPQKKSGRIVGLSEKIPLAVVGNGKDSLGDLVASNNHTKPWISDIFKLHQEKWDEILNKDEQKQLMYTGNRANGAKNLNRLDEADTALTAIFDKMSDYKNSLYYGRFDVKCRSLEDLKKGEHFAILEFNGAHSGYGHLYHCGKGIGEVYRTILGLWSELYDISFENHRRGHQFWSFRRGFKLIFRNQSYFKKIRAWEKEL